MADKRGVLSSLNLKGPTGSATTDKRGIVSQVNLHGPLDKRGIVSALTLVAPPLDLRGVVSQVKLVGPSSKPHPFYFGKNGAWVPVDAYLPSNGVWTKLG